MLSIESCVDCYFPSTPNISVCCLLTPSVSVENSSIRLIIAPLKLLFFPLVTFKGPWMVMAVVVLSSLPSLCFVPVLSLHVPGIFGCVLDIVFVQYFVLKYEA